MASGNVVADGHHGVCRTTSAGHSAPRCTTLFTVSCVCACWPFQGVTVSPVLLLSSIFPSAAPIPATAPGLPFLKRNRRLTGAASLQLRTASAPTARYLSLSISRHLAMRLHTNTLARPKRVRGCTLPRTAVPQRPFGGLQPWTDAHQPPLEVGFACCLSAHTQTPAHRHVPFMQTPRYPHITALSLSFSRNARLASAQNTGL